MLRRRPDRDSLNRPLNHALLHAKAFFVEVVGINGSRAPGQAMDQALLAFAGQIKVRIETAFTERQVPTNENGELTTPQLQVILGERGEGRRPKITILVAHRIEGFHGRGYYTRGPDGGDAIVISASGMRRGPVRALPASWCWAMVILHELLHAIGLPAEKSHTWMACHCTTPWCNLYAKADWRSILSAVVRLRLPMKLCRRCRSDLQQSPPVGWRESDPADREVCYLDELVALNRDNPRVYAMRADHFCRKQDQRAIPDLSKAIELGHRRIAGCYFNRGQMYLLAQNPQQARADFEACLRADPGHAGALTQLEALPPVGPQQPE